MTTSRFDVPKLENRSPKRVRRLQAATLVILGFAAFFGAIITGWFADESSISDFFQQLNIIQENPPFWLQVPRMMGAYLLAPSVILFLIALIITKVSPQPRRWSRFFVVGILLVLTLRYILWRSLSTLDLSEPLNGVFSLGLFFLEMLTLISSSIQLFLMLRVKDRRHEADQLSVAVIEGNFTPSVDVLIPTYNEPVFILRRTIIGCQALDYLPKKIYLLDDTRRPEMKKLAMELGCEYITRPDNYHAKAGNLNHAIAQTHGDLIVVFDADFIPTKNFLTRTIGFFQDKQIALVQTPQSFYNPDPIARNLGLENIVTPEEEVFYRQIQPIRDAAGSVICAGTSFVVRRSALKETGGFFTESLSEDYFTGIRLSAKGYRLIYLNEKLSAGLAAENMAAHATQRLRWAQGTLQAFFIEANPLTIPGLSPLQRLAHLEGLLHWFTTIPRVGFLLMPLAYSFLGVIPVRATAAELMYFFLPYYLVSFTVFSWLNYRSRSALLSDIYSIVLCFPLALTVIQAMLRPFGTGFKVTPKGTASDRFSFNWNLAWPLILLFIATAVSLWQNLCICMVADSAISQSYEIAPNFKGIGIGWVWSAYNLITIGIALLTLLDVPKPSIYEWFDLRRVVQLTLSHSAGDRSIAHTQFPMPNAQFPIPQSNIELWGITTMISEEGAEVALTQAGLPSLTPGETLPVTLEILEEGLELSGTMSQIGCKDEFPTVRIAFEQVSLNQHRRLVEMLFCRPGQWKRQETPGEFRSLLLLFRILLRPRVLFDRDRRVSAIALSKV